MAGWVLVNFSGREGWNSLVLALTNNKKVIQVQRLWAPLGSGGKISIGMAGEVGSGGEHVSSAASGDWRAPGSGSLPGP